MHAGEAVAEALREEGVERVYSVPGSHVHPIYDGLSRVKSIRMVTCKQEPNVSLMADAYGRLTGKPGVCVVTAGPGCINSMAGVAQAYGAASPMVHISGAVPLKADLEAFHGVDDPAFIHEMFRKITKWSARVERMEDIPGVMAKAFHIARSGRPGPVHIELPRLSDYSEFILQEAPAVLPAYQAIPIQVAKPEPKDVDRFARRLMESRSPVIAAGKGIIRKSALQELSELSLRLQAPVVFAQDAIGVIPEEHPFFAGHFQHYRIRSIATPESFMQSGVWNAMSYGLPTAIVAKMEFPGRDVVALAGDGAFLMTIGDLPTAVEYGANVLMIVLNDDAFGQTYMQQSNIYGHTYGTAFKSPDFAEIARACGVEGIRVTDPRHVEDALRQGLAATRNRPAMVEVMVARHPYPKI